MFENLKTKIAWFLLKRNYLDKRKRDTLLHNSFLTDSKSFFIIVPGYEESFDKYFEIAEYLEEKGKETSFLLSEAQNTVRSFEKIGDLLTYNAEDLNKFKLPKKEIAEKLSELKFDVIMNFADESDIFSMAVANIVECKYRVGVESLNSDMYYNFQLKGVSADGGDLIKKIKWAFDMF